MKIAEVLKKCNESENCYVNRRGQCDLLKKNKKKS